MILCDIGNSTFHFLIGESRFKIGVDESLELDLFDQIIDDEVYFISVNEKATEIFLNKFPKSINLQDKVQLDTSYSTTLGIDRIVACKFFEDGMIVDFGSAITIDIMDNKKHLGGFIFPGVERLKMAYPKISPKLQFEFKTNIDLDRLPQNTDEAITFAIVQMVILPIIEIQKKYNKTLIITGETAKPFLHYLKEYRFEEELIFNSMKKIIEGKI